MPLRSLSQALVPVLVVLVAVARAQYETYSFRRFPQKDIMPLESAYGHALELYAAQNWAESVKFLELSLRLHRLLRDGETFCSRNCSTVRRDNDTAEADGSLRVMRHVLLRAACVKRCKADFPVFALAYPRRDLLQAFEQRAPYRYIQYAQYQVRGSATERRLFFCFFFTPHPNKPPHFPCRLVAPPLAGCTRRGLSMCHVSSTVSPPENNPLILPSGRRGAEVHIRVFFWGLNGSRKLLRLCFSYLGKSKKVEGRKKSRVSCGSGQGFQW